MNLGAEPKKAVALVGLLLLAAWSIYTNVLSGPELPPQARSSSSTPSPRAPAAAVPTPSQQQTEQRLQTRRQLLGGRQSVGEFRPSLKPARPEDRPDPMKVDPTLRLDLLAKLQNVTVSGGGRSLFELGPDTPPPTTPDVAKIIPTKAPPKKGFLDTAMLHPQPKPPETKAGEAVKPPPPPIPLKFYGYSSPRMGGARRAFFLDGEDIHVVHEGDLVKKRYKIVEIKLNSVVVEDTEFKHQQTLPLEQPPAAG